MFRPFLIENPHFVALRRLFLSGGPTKFEKMRDFGPKVAFFCHLGGKSQYLRKIERGIEAYFEDEYLRKPKPVKLSL